MLSDAKVTFAARWVHWAALSIAALATAALWLSYFRLGDLVEAQKGTTEAVHHLGR